MKFTFSFGKADENLSGFIPLRFSNPTYLIYFIVVGLEASILNEYGESPLAYPDSVSPKI